MINIGARAGSTIAPVSAFTKRTKEIALTVTSSQTGWSTTRAVGVFYADSAGVWRLSFNIVGTFSSTSAIDGLDVSVTGVSFKNTSSFYQAISGFIIQTSTIAFKQAWANPNGALAIRYAATLTNASAVQLSGDVELNAEPTTYTTAANLEGNVNVAAYFPNASTTPGLLNFYAEDDTTLGSVYWLPDASGTSKSSVFAVKITRVGRTVTLTFPSALDATAANSTTVATIVNSSNSIVKLPTWAIPAYSVRTAVHIRAAGVYENTPGSIFIRGGSGQGDISISKTINSDAFGNGACGLLATSITYNV